MNRAVSDQERAQAAYKRVAARAKEPHWKKYRSMTLKLPVMIHREGLLPALHFVAARSEEGQRAILDDLAEDLGKTDRTNLLDWARGLGAAELIEGTYEIQRRVGWYKRITQSFGKDGADPSQGGAK